MKPNPRWWWPYAAAAAGISIGMFALVFFAEHYHSVAVASAQIFAGLFWFLAIYKIAQWGDAEMARQRELTFRGLRGDSPDG